MNISNEEFKFLLERNKFLMPNYMLEYHEELLKYDGPSISLPKKEYIHAWIYFFDQDMVPNNFNNLSKDFMGYSTFSIKKGFEWVRDNFCALDMGGNMTWYALARKVIAAYNGKTWTPEKEKKIILSRIYETSWGNEL